MQKDDERRTARAPSGFSKYPQLFFERLIMQDKRNIENVVQEIMGLVGSYGTAVHDNSTGNPSDYTLAHAESAAYNAIESKLREIVENSLSVREPLSEKLPKWFLADVVTAAGLVEHGKQSKALGERLAYAVMQIRASNFAKDS